MSKNNNEEQSQFYGGSLDKEEWLKDEENYTDVVESNIRRKKIIITVIISLGILTIVIGGFFFNKYIFNNPDSETSTPEQTTSTSETDTGSDQPLDSGYTAPENKMTQLLPNFTKSDGEEDNAFVEDNTIQTSSGNTLTINNSNLDGSVNECKVRNSTDFCYLTAVTTEDTKKTYQTYFLKDAVNSRFFENADLFEQVEVSNHPAATMTVHTLDNNSTPVLVVLNEDGSGYMFVNAEGVEDYTNLIQNIQ